MVEMELTACSEELGKGLELRLLQQMVLLVLAEAEVQDQQHITMQVQMQQVVPAVSAL